MKGKIRTIGISAFDDKLVRESGLVSGEAHVRGADLAPGIEQFVQEVLREVKAIA